MTYTKDLQQWLQQTVWLSPEAIAKDRKWYIVDAAWKTLWRVAVEVAKKLHGKHKPYYCDMWDCGDNVIIINAEKITVTWNKMVDKIYYKHTWWKGHLRETNFQSLLKKHPQRVFEFAVRWMLPKNKLRKQKLKRMRVFVWSKHPYAQFSPEVLDAK